MAFAIEVQAETNPLTESLLIHALRAASSSDSQQIQVGTKQLQQWETAEHFYVYLHAAYLDRQQPFPVRYLAVIQLKNGIDKYWRKTALNAVSSQDKTIIRDRLIDAALNEPDHRLALQDALVIAKIARWEFPGEWPDLITTILDRFREGSEAGVLLITSRALLVLLQVTKELSKGRLQKSKQTLQSVTPEIVRTIGNFYATHTRDVEAAIQGSHQLIQDNLEQCLLCIRVLRRLLIAGYENPNRDSDVASFWRLSSALLGSFVRLSKADIPPPIHEFIGKHMLQLSKLHHEMARDHSASFALMPNSIDLVLAYWSIIKEVGESFGSREAVASAVASAQIGTDGDTIDRPMTERLALRGMLIIRACIRMIHYPSQTFKYRTPRDKEERSQAIDLIQQQILTVDFVKEIVNIIVTRYFVFRASDLREWEEEPDEWEKREEADGEAWEFSMRPCAEKLFLDLAINWKDVLVQPLIDVFQSIATPSNEDILLKDSIYTAIGLAAPILVNHLDFDAFIRDTLVTEVQKTNPGFSIIRRRAAIILAQWQCVKGETQSRALVYQIFKHLLSKDDQPLNDRVVRVTAGRQLKNVVDEWYFAVDDFMPTADTVLTNLMHLIGEVELMETKMALLSTISIIVERLQYRISPYAERIMNLLPLLWEQSGDEHLMKQAILTVLARLVSSMGADSVPVHASMIPIIENAVRGDTDAFVYLLEDAMELWHNILIQTPSDAASAELLGLSQHLFNIFDQGSESLRKALEIAESYVLVAPSFMLSDEMRQRIFAAMAALIGSLKPDANGLVFVLLEGMIRAGDKLAGESAVVQVTSDLLSTGVLHKLVSGLRGSWKAHCTTGPLAKEPPVDGMVETDYLAILARLILGSTDHFCQALQQIGSSLDPSTTNLADTMNWLLEEWFSHLDNIGDPSRRKLMCLALTKLLESNQPWILVKLQSLMTMWTDIIREMYEDLKDQSGDSLVRNAVENAGDGPEAAEEARRREMTLSDPVHTVQIAAWIKHYLQQSMASQASFQDEWLANVDKEVVNGFAELGIL